MTIPPRPTRLATPPANNPKMFNPDFRRPESLVQSPAVKVLSLLLALAMSVMAAPNQPAQVAVDFLDKVRAGKLNLEPGGDTALTANTDVGKRREITRRLERTATDLGTGTLESCQTRLDENLAAVLVRKIGGFDPSRLRVFAVALVKHGETWLPAPVLASFENTGVGYAPGLRQRLDALESWMLEQQVLELDTIQQQATARMRSEILAMLPLGELRTLGPYLTGMRFLDACGKQQLPIMLGLLGGLQSVLPDDWTKRLQAAESAATAPLAAKRPWRLLTAPDILRTVVQLDSADQYASIDVACLDPAGTPGTPSQARLEIIRLDLSKSQDGLWQVDPPSAFFLTNEQPEEAQADAASDEKLLALYPAALRNDIPLQSLPTAQAALKALEQAMLATTLRPMIAMLGLAAEAKTARLGCTRAAAAWGALHDPACVRHALPLSTFETDSVAAASFQYFSVREPDRMDVHVFFIEKSPDGWRLPAGFQPTENAAGNWLAAQTWATGEAKRWNDKWRVNCLSSSTRVATLAQADAPPADQARSLVESWLAAIRAGNVPQALALTAWLDPDKSPSRVLRNLGYEINGARKSKFAAVITAVSRGKTWTTVAVRAINGDKSSHPVYPVVSTPQGPKILIEIDWFANAERGREFLNNTAVSHLRNFASQETTDELQDLFNRSQAIDGH